MLKIKNIYEINPALLGGIIAIILEFLAIMFLPL